MAHYVFDEHVYCVWATSVASISAPTVAEINAGVNLSTYLLADGIKHGGKETRVDNSDITSRHDHEFFGSYGEAPELTLLRDDGTGSNLAWTTFKAGYVNGFLCIRTGPLFTTAPAISQEWEIYPAQSGPVRLPDSARNTRVTFIAPVAVTSTPSRAAVMA